MLSRDAFKVKQGALRQQQSDGHVQQGYNLELSGPILPQCYQNILSLFKDTHGEFTTSFSVVESTTPFNGVPVGDDLNVSPMKDAQTACLGKEAMRELHYRGVSYHWTVY